jgi:hypothetical protein
MANFLPERAVVRKALLHWAQGRPSGETPAMRSHADPYPQTSAQLLLAERGIEVDHVTIYRWVQRFAPEFAEAARARQLLVGDRWHVDETYLKVGGPGATCSGPSTSSARSSTSSSRCGGTQRPRGDSSPRRSAALGSHPPRSPPTGTVSTHASSMSCSRPPSTTRRSTPTIRSRPTRASQGAPPTDARAEA